ncbi:cell adhesion molecule DSCAM-like [Lytechinus pictus]|uniref:cell adhesion molecule DSCAM-like n=1 Tax=Lytechinus pictus TaxID=7653 RepID=UPI0030B9EAB9
MAMVASAYNKHPVILILTAMIWTQWMHLAVTVAQQTVVSTPDHLSAKEGETVTLVCSYEPKTDDLYFASLSWQMGLSVLAAYSCPNACIRSNQNPDHYSLEVDLISSGNLTIRDVSLEDDNVYQCIVTSFYGTAGSTSRLIVNVPPVSIELSDTMTSVGHGQGVVVPVLSGQTHTFTCTTQPGANPPADLEWTSTTARITQDDTVDQPVTGSKLTMSSREVTFIPSMADHLTAVTCEASHPAFVTPLTKFIQLDVQVPPTNVTIAFNAAIISNGGTLTLDEGSANIVTCKSIGTRPASAITWYLDGVHVTSGVRTPEYSPSANDSRLQDASSSIIIQPSREHHGQFLRCQATTFGISRGVGIRLSVDGPPDPPVISGIPDAINENQETSITCEADNGHPSPSFQWFIGTRNISAHATLQVSADASNRIDALSQLRYLPLREDNGLVLQCSVIHDQLSQPMRVTSDTLVVNYCPTTVEVTICPDVEAGSSEVIVCRSGASNPASNLVWIQGVVTINEPNDLEIYYEESSEPLGTHTTLSYMRNFTRQDYRQNFKCCTIVGPSCDSTVCSEPCVPDVKFPPEEPIISRSITARQIFEGVADLEFICRAEGNPRPALTWVMADNEGLMLDQMTKEDGSQILRFRDVRRHHVGVYRCIANNNIPPMSSNYGQLVVLFTPTFLSNDNLRETADEGQNATLTCVIKANPSPVVNWERLGNHSAQLFDRTLVVNNEMKYSDYESTVTSTLKIFDVQPDIDHGNYRCTAVNVVGRVEAVINLNATSIPDPPSLMFVEHNRTTSSTLFVTWQPGFDGGHRQAFTLQYCPNNTQVDEDGCGALINRTGTSCRLVGLHPSTWYRLTMWAVNRLGTSSAVETMASTSDSTAPRQTPVLPIALGVTGAVVLILLTVLVAMHFCGALGWKGEDIQRGNQTVEQRIYTDLNKDRSSLSPCSPGPTTSLYMGLKPIPGDQDYECIGSCITQDKSGTVYMNIEKSDQVTGQKKRNLEKCSPGPTRKAPAAAYGNTDANVSYECISAEYDDASSALQKGFNTYMEIGM